MEPASEPHTTGAPVVRRKRSWGERILLTIAILFVGGLLLVVGSCLALFGVRARDAAREATLNKQRAAPLIVALERYQKTQGHCPEALDALVPEFVPELPRALRRDHESTFHYRCAKDGRRFWVAFDDSSGVFLPSDIVYEYDSQPRTWWSGDISSSGFLRQD